MQDGVADRHQFHAICPVVEGPQERGCLIGMAGNMGEAHVPDADLLFRERVGAPIGPGLPELPEEALELRSGRTVP